MFHGLLNFVQKLSMSARWRKETSSGDLKNIFLVLSGGMPHFSDENETSSQWTTGFWILILAFQGCRSGAIHGPNMSPRHGLFSSPSFRPIRVQKQTKY